MDLYLQCELCLIAALPLLFCCVSWRNINTHVWKESSSLHWWPIGATHCFHLLELDSIGNQGHVQGFLAVFIPLIELMMIFLMQDLDMFNHMGCLGDYDQVPANSLLNLIPLLLYGFNTGDYKGCQDVFYRTIISFAQFPP